jgi:hypothetical protein
MFAGMRAGTLDISDAVEALGSDFSVQAVEPACSLVCRETNIFNARTAGLLFPVASFDAELCGYRLMRLPVYVRHADSDRVVAHLMLNDAE